MNSNIIETEHSPDMHYDYLFKSNSYNNLQ